MASKTPFSFPTFKTLSTLFFVFALLVLLIVALSTAGRVEVQVRPPLTTRVVDSFFTLTSSPTPNPGELHANFNSVVLEAKAPIESPTSEVRPVKARYAIVIHNQYSRDQALISTTRFLFNNVLYRLTDSVAVKAGTSLHAVVEADQAGAGFERTKGEKLTIPGLWSGVQPYIFGIVDNEIRPGLVTVTVASQHQIDAAGIAAFRELEHRRTELIQGDKSLYVFHQDAEPVKQSPEPGEIESAEVAVNQPIKYISISQNSLEGSLRDSFGKIEPDKRFYYDHADVKFEVMDWKDQAARLRVTIPVRFFTQLSQDQFSISDFRGKSESEIITFLNDHYAITEAAVNYSPNWLKSLLSRFGAVNITILEP